MTTPYEFDSSAYLPSPEALLRFHKLRPKKAWGQCFLRDTSVLKRIVLTLAPRPEDRVVELGAGLGHLTSLLAATGAEVLAVERDRELVPVLEGLFSAEQSITVMPADAKNVDYGALAKPDEKLLVAGNLPYHLTTPILFSLLEQRRYISRVVIMVQKEVAERLVAKPGGKDYGVLTVQAGMWADSSIAFDVMPGSFFPQPGVISSVLKVTFRDKPVADPGNPELFQRLVRGAFAQRRKTLRNTLRAVGIAEPETIDEALRLTGIDPTLRAETLSITQLAELSKAMSALE